MTLVLLLLFSVLASAQHNFAEIDTCYHWLSGPELNFKVKYAKENNGAFYFHNNGPIYCWRSPLGAQSGWEDHGDELIRIKLRPGIRIAHRPRINDVQTMTSLGFDVIYSNNNAWHEYTLAPSAIESWSVYHMNTITEMKAEYQYWLKETVVPDDVFFPFQNFERSFYKSIIPGIITQHETAAKRKYYFYGENKEDHFRTQYVFSWHKYLDVDRHVLLAGPPSIKVTSAYYGKGDVTAAAAKFCDGKMVCTYKVSTRFIGDPQPNVPKAFVLTYSCGGRPFTVTRPAPAEDKIFTISCN